MEEGWERSPRLELRRDQLQHLVEPAFPGQALAESVVLTSGLANTSIRFRLERGRATYVLRLHMRDAAAAARELDLMKYLAASAIPVPVAPLIYSDPVPERGEHPYSIWCFVEGTLLHALFGMLSPSELVGIAGTCGQVLASISAHRFVRCGEFGPGLSVVREYGRPSEFVPEVVHRALFGARAGERLGATLREDLWRVVERAAPRLAPLDDRYALVHADYKRSNLLMQPSGTSFRVGAVLDWEFAFAGPPLVDVGLFLRAGEALPQGFREAFASGYRHAGGELPADWLPLSRLLDVVSQMEFLNDSRERPRVFAETIGVLRETLRMLS